MSSSTPPIIPATTLPVGGRLTLKARLQHGPVWVFTLVVSLAGFVVYGSMYGFRKPYTAASYEGFTFFGISYKVALVIAQVIGYTLSKFYGIRFIAGMRPERRAGFIILLVATSWASLLLFALIPPPYNVFFMFVNGLPLGMVWGLVFGFMEGRKVTEVMGAVVSTSFIFASGLGKTVGKMLLLHGVSELWMPFLAGAVFIVPLLLSTWILSQTPPPTPEDIAQRTIRLPMDKQQRRSFLRKFGLALAPVVIAYVMLTILRDFSEDFANELWNETGFRNNADVFANTGTIASLVVLAVFAGFFLIRNNYRAFQLNNVVIIGGFLLAAGSTFAFHLHVLSPGLWIVTASVGVYLGYVPYNSFYFERMIATYRIQGNVGFLIYIADAFGYLGTVVALLVKEFMHFRYSWVDFFSGMFYFSAVGGILLVLWSSGLFAKIYRRNN
jgi:hypothetical protein